MKLTKQLQAMGQRRRRAAPKRLPPQALPVSLERNYAKYLSALVTEIYKTYFDALRSLKGQMPGDQDRLDALLRPRAFVTDAPSDLPPGFRAKLDAAARKIGKRLDRKRLAKFLDNHAARTDDWSNKEFAKQARAAVGVDILTDNPKLQKQVEGFTKKNVKLITKVGRDTKKRVEAIVVDSIAKGRSYEALSERLQDDMGIGQRRAVLIARDQTGKLYGQINAERQRELGITRFTWRTSNDNRVREEHAELEGETFEYANPPSEGLPGEAIQCRCYAEPVFDMLADL